MQFVNRHIHFTHASVTCTCLVITVKDAGSYSSTLTKSRTSKNTATVSHPNTYAFFSHLQNTTADQSSDVSRLRNVLNIGLRRPKSKANIINESRVKSCLAKFDDGSYSQLQFLCAVSQSMGAHTAALQPAYSDDDDDDGSYTNYDVHGHTLRQMQPQTPPGKCVS